MYILMTHWRDLLSFARLEIRRVVVDVKI